MGIHYCMYCGMPIPRKARICPECGASQELPPPQSETQEPQPRLAEETKRTPQQRQRSRRRRKTNNMIAVCFVIGMTVIFGAVLFLVFDAAEGIRRARSRHQENQMDAQGSSKPTIREFSMPEISMPEISIPEIHLPEPPAAEFTVESYQTETNLLGETVLYVNLNYKNTDETAKCFLTSFRISVEQEGTSCRLTAGDPTKENHIASEVQPDETVTVTEAFLISPEKETAVSVHAYFGAEPYLEDTILPHADGTVSAAEK